jgi:hypothetical protein
MYICLLVKFKKFRIMKKALFVILLGFMGISLFAQTSFEAPFKELPKDAQKYVTKTYAGWTVDKCLQEDNAKQKMTSCTVYISKGTEKVKLIFDKDGEFVKKEDVTEAAKAQPAVTAVPTPAVAPSATPAAVPTTAPAVAPSAVVAPAVAPVATPETKPAPAPVPETVPPVK